MGSPNLSGSQLNLSDLAHATDEIEQGIKQGQNLRVRISKDGRFTTKDEKGSAPATIKRVTEFAQGVMQNTENTSSSNFEKVSVLRKSLNTIVQTYDKEHMTQSYFSFLPQSSWQKNEVKAAEEVIKNIDDLFNREIDEWAKEGMGTDANLKQVYEKAARDIKNAWQSNRSDLHLDNRVKSLPPVLGLFTYLNTLVLNDVVGNNTLPTGIGQLKNLTFLNVSGSHIETLPNEVEQLEKLETLNVSFTRLKEFPENILARCPNIETIELRHTLITTLPLQIVEQENLKEIYIYGNQITEQFFVNLLASLKSKESRARSEHLNIYCDRMQIPSDMVKELEKFNIFLVRY